MDDIENEIIRWFEWFRRSILKITLGSSIFENLDEYVAYLSQMIFPLK